MPHDTSGREAILETSARLFGEKGYTGVSIRDIAQACGMTNAALYYHFKNKDELFLAMLRRTHERVMASLADALSPAGDLRARLKQLIARYGEVMCSQRQSFQTLRRDMAHIDDARAGNLFGEMHADFLRPIQQLVEAGQAEGAVVSGDAQRLARLLHGMILALAFEGGPGHLAKVEAEDIDTLVSVFLNGAGKPPER